MQRLRPPPTDELRALTALETLRLERNELAALPDALFAEEEEEEETGGEGGGGGGGAAGSLRSLECLAAYENLIPLHLSG